MAAWAVPIAVRSPPPSVGLWALQLRSRSLSPLASRSHYGAGVCGCRRGLHISAPASWRWEPLSRFFSGVQEHCRVRRRPAVAVTSCSSEATEAQPVKEKEVELSVRISVDDAVSDDHEVSSIVEVFKMNVPMAMKAAFQNLKCSEHKSREPTTKDILHYQKIELSVVLCNNSFMRKLKKDGRNEDCATGILTFAQHVPDVHDSHLKLGDIFVSVEIAAKYAQEKDHTLLDEVRILLVHGLLQLLGFDRNADKEAESEIEKDVHILLKSLGWKGKASITSASDSNRSKEKFMKDRKNPGSLRFYRPKFKYIFCDMDGTLLNSKSQITEATAEALREAMSRGVNIIVATGKARPAVIDALKPANLCGRHGIVSESSPGVFLQGLMVYGQYGREIYRRKLDQDVSREAFLYSSKHKIPLVAFCQDRCFTLFDHPLVKSLHLVFHEPEAEVVSSIDWLLTTSDIQKLLFLESPEKILSSLRPYWEEATKGRAGVVQAQPDMLEIVPSGTSKGKGVKILLDHLGAKPSEIMAIGDGENDIEMLQLASLGVALANGSEKSKAVADVIGATNDEDGAAKAIYEYAF